MDHDSDIEPRLFHPGFRVKGGGLRALPVSVSPASPPQGELNGQQGLVPSNFLEGPGPETGGSDREPGTLQAEGQVSEALGSQLSSLVSMPLVWWGGQDGVAGGVQWAGIQVCPVPRVELRATARGSPARVALRATAGGSPARVALSLFPPPPSGVRPRP